jgi:RNA-directed DNA polymerase
LPEQGILSNDCTKATGAQQPGRGHYHLARFLQHRIADRGLLRIIQRFLKAGVMEDGAVTAGEEGTPQGGLVSPVLSNIYLHYVLDMWFEKRFARGCGGKAFLIRYCDDFIACFQHEGDARGFLAELRKRLASFELEVEPSKTELIRFGSAAPWHCRKEGLRRPKTFTFLGITHYVSRSRRGYFVVGRRTERKRFRRKLQALSERLRALRVRGGTAMLNYFRQHLQGHFRYYGVSGNHRQMAAYAYFASRLLYKWLNRRSQRRSTTWARFRTLLHGRWLPTLRIYHNLYPMPLWKTQVGSRMV